MRFTAFLCLLAIIVVAPLGAHGLGSREKRPNLVSGELGGRALIYSANYERYITNQFGIGVGGMGAATGAGGFALFPLYVSFIPVGEIHSLYLSAGATVAAGTSNWDEIESIWFGTVAIGYQYQAEGGFVVRPTVNLMYRESGFLVWPGITMGGSF